MELSESYLDRAQQLCAQMGHAETTKVQVTVRLLEDGLITQQEITSDAVEA